MVGCKSDREKKSINVRGVMARLSLSEEGRPHTNKTIGSGIVVGWEWVEERVGLYLDHFLSSLRNLLWGERLDIGFR